MTDADRLDVDVLRDAILDVEAGYIYQPDRTTRSYADKVAKRYEYLRAAKWRNDESTERTDSA